MGIFGSEKKQKNGSKPDECPYQERAELNEDFNYHEHSDGRIKDVQPVDGESDSE